jgi:hypothetical protein
MLKFSQIFHLKKKKKKLWSKILNLQEIFKFFFEMKNISKLLDYLTNMCWSSQGTIEDIEFYFYFLKEKKGGVWGRGCCQSDAKSNGSFYWPGVM